jgi:hypothetical protein
VCAALALAVGAAAPPRALADGDPASDVLASQLVYVPGDGDFAPAQTAQLNGLLTAARHAGVPVRVALIATQADLGSVTELWAKPQSYAEFLGQELAQVYRGRLVVAMPAGIGVYDAGKGGGQAPATGATANRSSLVSTAMHTVEDLAAAAGHRLTPPAAVTTPKPGSALGSVDLGSWLALAAGAALIALAWTASLRVRGPGARPPARGPGARPPGDPEPARPR